MKAIVTDNIQNTQRYILHTLKKANTNKNNN